MPRMTMLILLSRGEPVILFSLLKREGANFSASRQIFRSSEQQEQSIH